MSDESRRVLDLLAQGKITVDEADQLLRAIGTPPQSQSQTEAASPNADEGERPKPRFIRINVHKPANDHRREKDVNIRVPIAVVKGGMRLGALIAPLAGEHAARKMRERGFDLDLSKLDGPAFESLLKDMEDVNIEVDNGKEQIRITCE